MRLDTEEYNNVRAHAPRHCVSNIGLTKGHVVVALYRDILSLFHIVYALKDGETMSHTGDAHALQVIVMQRHQSLADDFIFCGHDCVSPQGALLERELSGDVPTKRSAYCVRPMLPMKSAHSSAVHSVTMVSGSRSALSR
jgi:hypothetical protein